MQAGIGNKNPDGKLEQGQYRNNNDDVEAGGKAPSGGASGGGALYPEMVEDPKLRWAFIRKVYLILAVQFLMTAAIAVTFNRVRPIPKFVVTYSHASVACSVIVLILPLIALFPMLHFARRHPVNMVFLGLFTLCISLLVGWLSAMIKGVFLLEAAFVTTIVLFGLSLYTFWAARRGHEFEFLGPFLFVSSLVLLTYLIVQIYLPFQFHRISMSIYGCMATIIYSGFIIYDTDNLIKRHKYDEYTFAAVRLYLDVINLFMSVLGITAFSL